MLSNPILYAPITVWTSQTSADPLPHPCAKIPARYPCTVTSTLQIGDGPRALPNAPRFFWPVDYETIRFCCKDCEFCFPLRWVWKIASECLYGKKKATPPEISYFGQAEYQIICGFRAWNGIFQVVAFFWTVGHCNIEKSDDICDCFSL